MVWFDIIQVLFLVMLSGLFSGLTLGLMGLDLSELQIVIGGGSIKDAENAKKILPIRRNGNLLLCTLLLGNVSVNAALSIVLANLTTGTIGFLSSTILITIFGEILPQAICSRHPLAVGAHTVWLVRIFMLVLFVVVYPLSKALDRLLGEEMGTLYTKTELNKVLEMHKAAPGIQNEELQIMTGALNFGTRQVKDIMTPIEQAYMLDVHRTLNFEVLTEIFKAGYSRVPVCDSSRPHNPVVGLLLVKDLILLDPMDATPVWTIVNFYGRTASKVFPDCPLQELLEQFKAGKSHMAIVHDVNNSGNGDPFYENVGLVTLEDIIEEILQSEIVDETDEFVDLRQGIRRNNRNNKGVFGPRRLMPDRITPQEISAIFFHLSGAVPLFHPEKRLLTEASLRNLIQKSRVIDLKIPKNATPEELDDEKYWIYRRGEVSDDFTLILDGKVDIYAGRAGFQSELGRWSVLCVDGLEDVHDSLPNDLNDDELKLANLPKLKEYKPDFSARVKENCRLLKISRIDYYKAILDQTPDQFAARQKPRSVEQPMKRTNSILKSVPLPQDSDENISSSTSQVVVDIKSEDPINLMQSLREEKK